MNAETVTIINWVMNDRPVYNRLRAILKGEDGYSGPRASAKRGNSPEWQDVPAQVPNMADFIEHLVRWDDGSSYRQLYAEDRKGGFEAHIPRRVRNELGLDVWYTVNWGEVVRHDAVDWFAVQKDLLREDRES